MRKIPIIQCIQIVIGFINIALLSIFFTYLYCCQFQLSIDQKGMEGIVSILLTCLGVILTGIAVFFSILGVYGYNSIKSIAVKSAEDAIENQIQLIVPRISTMIDEKLEARRQETNNSDQLLNRIFTAEASEQLKARKE